MAILSLMNGFLFRACFCLLVTIIILCPSAECRRYFRTLPAPSLALSAAVVNNTVIFAGGCSNVCHDFVFAFDVATNATYSANLSLPRRDMATSVVGDKVKSFETLSYRN